MDERLNQALRTWRAIRQRHETGSAARLAEHDETLLVTALEDLQAQRVAIEWLLDADLLCLCVV